jgi:hypothetical protein
MAQTRRARRSTSRRRSRPCAGTSLTPATAGPGRGTGTAAPALIRGRDELEASGEVVDAARARDADAPVLEGLAERLEHVLVELGQLVQEEDTAVGERDLARMRRAAAADEAGDRDRVMGGAEGTRGVERAPRGEESRHAPDRGDLDDLVPCRRGQDLYWSCLAKLLRLSVNPDSQRLPQDRCSAFVTRGNPDRLPP